VWAPTRGALIGLVALVGLVRLLVALLPVAASFLLLLMAVLCGTLASSPSCFQNEEKAWSSSGWRWPGG
jgi:hypothetical protein